VCVRLFSVFSLLFETTFDTLLEINMTTFQRMTILNQHSTPFLSVFNNTVLFVKWYVT
jgi:hypothetical protein